MICLVACFLLVVPVVSAAEFVESSNKLFYDSGAKRSVSNYYNGNVEDYEVSFGQRYGYNQDDGSLDFKTQTIRVGDTSIFEKIEEGGEEQITYFPHRTVFLRTVRPENDPMISYQIVSSNSGDVILTIEMNLDGNFKPGGGEDKN